MIYWFTGQPGHGKTTLGKELLGYLQTQGVKTMFIDGDQLRDIFKNVNYGKEGRVENSCVIAFVQSASTSNLL